MKPIVIATRKSPLALAQSEMVAAALRAATGRQVTLLKMVTTGDRQTNWSLEREGGKGLFTGELEQALLRGEADVAVHSAKDLPGENPAGLTVAGYLPRADPRDVLVMREEVERPQTIATSSPRRRMQAGMVFPEAEFTEIRGNVDTRLRKIATDHAADATLLAAAGLARLGIAGWQGLVFHPLGFETMVPAVGQAAIALQCRSGEEPEWVEILDSRTGRAVALERAVQVRLGGGCQSAIGVHAAADTLWFFHHAIGLRSEPLADADLAAPGRWADTFLDRLGLGGTNAG
tara:strand:+ start:483 stop:1352 length:870 start_codon:yes stop_codon:yes gene_type:complete